MVLPFFTIFDLDIEDKTVLMRVDINSPINPETGEILSLKRIEEHARSIKKLPACKLVLLAHQSRPGKKDFFPLEEHARVLSKVLDRDVRYVDSLFHRSALEAIEKMEIGDIILLENSRFYAEEVALTDASMDVQERSHIVRSLTKVASIFINDAFSAVHRSQPTLVGFTRVLPSCAGPVMEKELRALSRVTDNPEKPCIAILGGLKVDDSIKVAENLLKNSICDLILTTGVVGSMFQWAAGYDLGTVNINFIRREIPDADAFIERCRKMMAEHPDKIEYPSDMAMNIGGNRKRVTLDGLPAEGPIYDIDIETIAHYSNIIREAKTIIANGPSGVYEVAGFSEGTVETFRAINASSAYSVMGGGETTAVIKDMKFNNIDHVSTGGGALINYLSGKEMPVLSALKRSKEIFMNHELVKKTPK
ncbi:MAG: phosphoglycerate kinase [Candidatus Thermoplasmatota archaeon]|nr:phosphoglycerate kinase [Candidatus Thermoplasmatota archaeon]